MVVICFFGVFGKKGRLARWKYLSLGMRLGLGIIFLDVVYFDVESSLKIIPFLFCVWG